MIFQKNVPRCPRCGSRWHTDCFDHIDEHLKIGPLVLAVLITWLFCLVVIVALIIYLQDDADACEMGKPDTTIEQIKAPVI